MRNRKGYRLQGRISVDPSQVKSPTAVLQVVSVAQPLSGRSIRRVRGRHAADVRREEWLTVDRNPNAWKAYSDGRSVAGISDGNQREPGYRRQSAGAVRAGTEQRQDTR